MTSLPSFLHSIVPSFLSPFLPSLLLFSVHFSFFLLISLLFIPSYLPPPSPLPSCSFPLTFSFFLPTASQLLYRRLLNLIFLYYDSLIQWMWQLRACHLACLFPPILWTSAREWFVISSYRSKILITLPFAVASTQSAPLKALRILNMATLSLFILNLCCPTNGLLPLLSSFFSSLYIFALSDFSYLVLFWVPILPKLLLPMHLCAAPSSAYPAVSFNNSFAFAFAFANPSVYFLI